jgi:hypothetical protein
MFSDFSSSLFRPYIREVQAALLSREDSRKHPENTGHSAPYEIFRQSSFVPYASFALLILAAAAKVNNREKQR